jgi:prepilin-type N-terminal cleavage/methylation domain-containing protein
MPRRVVPHFAPGPSAGFTLVEVLIVVVILGIMAALVVPQYAGARREVEQGAFINDIRVFCDAAALYHHEQGEYPIDSSSGVMPTGFDRYVPQHKWEGGTPIGGVWDHESGSDFGYRSAVGVHFNTSDRQDDNYMLQIDGRMDNGDLTSSSFQKIASDRYYRIVAQ